jgi:hypothetical protein
MAEESPPRSQRRYDMPRYIVKRPEVHYQYVAVDADDPEDAIREAAEAGGENLEKFEYLYTLTPHEERYEVVKQPSVVIVEPNAP